MPKEKKPLKIAVIGCGINGISCAISLAERGHTIHLINIFGGKWTSGPSLGLKVSNMIETNSD